MLSKKNKLIAPVVKWVGGKRQIMASLIEHIPKNYTTYYEPFVGGGALLFHLQPQKAIVNDFNDELINVYKVIKSHPEELIRDLKKHKNESDYFYKIRSIDRTKKFNALSDIERASRVIFLNKTCFNGLYRVNSSGEFNTPFGRYKNPNIVNEPTIRAVNKFLNSNKIQLFSGDYENILKNPTKGSFVYLDPPYHPVSESSNFTGYVQGGWEEDDQIRLKNVCDRLNSKGIKFLLSNSAVNFITDLYKNYTITFVKATRSINSDGDKRGEIDEVLIKNYG